MLQPANTASLKKKWKFMSWNCIDYSHTYIRKYIPSSIGVWLGQQVVKRRIIMIMMNIDWKAFVVIYFCQPSNWIEPHCKLVKVTKANNNNLDGCQQHHQTWILIIMFCLLVMTGYDGQRWSQTTVIGLWRPHATVTLELVSPFTFSLIMYFDWFRQQKNGIKVKRFALIYTVIMDSKNGQ